MECPRGINLPQRTNTPCEISQRLSDSDKKSSYSEIAAYTGIISDLIAIRIYSSTEPRNLKIADLQKGIVLLYKGKELVCEGTGFGVPILKYIDETFFSGSAILKISKQENQVIISKEFIMDRVSRDKFREHKLENSKIRTLIDHISSLYQSNKGIAKFILLLKENLFKLGVKSVFVKMAPKGKVNTTYIINRDKIKVRVDFTQFDGNNLQKIFILNEQGSEFFKKYSDSSGITLFNEQIGVWNEVTSQSATIMNCRKNIGFTLKNIDGAILRRGREFLRGSLDWIGLDYELDAKCKEFEYEIEILGVELT